VSVPFDYLGGVPVVVPAPQATPGVPSPQEFLGNYPNAVSAIDGLTDAIHRMPAPALAPKLTKSLLKKLDNAKKQMSKENPCAAANMLGAFQNEVEAQRGKQIADGAAVFLIGSADHLIAQLVQSLPAGKTCRLD
jgi:hypothetical protein